MSGLVAMAALTVEKILNIINGIDLTPNKVTANEFATDGLSWTGRRFESNDDTISYRSFNNTQLLVDFERQSGLFFAQFTFDTNGFSVGDGATLWGTWGSTGLALNNLPISGVTTLTASGTITYDGTGAAGLTLRRDTTEGAGVGIRFEHVNDASQTFLAAAAFGVMRDETDGTEDGSFLIQAVTNGSVGDVADFDGTTGLTLGNGLGLNIGGVDLYAEEVTIADDAAIQLNPPRNGGWMSLTAGGVSSFPRNGSCALINFDCGGSALIRQLKPSAMIDANGVDNTTIASEVDLLQSASGDSDLTGTTGNNNKITVQARSGTGYLYLENRIGNSITFQIVYH